jgi:DNA-directed RNA polymerase subunit M
MEFCSKCGVLLIPKKKGSKVALYCRKCETFRSGKVKSSEFKIASTSAKSSEKIIIFDKKSKLEILPKTHVQCPKCEHNEAYWWMQQTRAADEAPTRFYKCCKCENIWREYE